MALEMVAWEVVKIQVRVLPYVWWRGRVSQQLNKPQNIIFRRELWSIRNIGFGEL